MDYAHARESMIAHQLISRGISDPAVLEAFRAVPREMFLPEPDRIHAYEDSPQPIGQRQTISQPYIVAYMTELLRAPPGGRILEIGTGSGYQTAILLALGHRVWSIERIEELSLRAEAALDLAGAQLGWDMDRLFLRVDDGSLGWPGEAPFDGILVAAAAPEPPPALLGQLAEGGRMVIPAGRDDDVRLRLIRRQGGQWNHEDHLPVRFVPLVGKQGWPDARSRSS